MNNKFWLRHFYIPLFCFIVISTLLELTNIDITVSKLFYNTETAQFGYKEHWLTSDVLHDGGKYFSTLILLTIIVMFIGSFKLEKLKKYKKGFIYLIASMLTGSLVVYILKLLTHVHCPWDLAIFGGDTPYIRTFSQSPANMSPGRCFPAAHASAGYAFLSFYFFSLVYMYKYRFIALGLGLVAGALYGGAQQLRGAHFLSHDLWTLSICWGVSLFYYRIFFNGNYPDKLDRWACSRSS